MGVLKSLELTTGNSRVRVFAQVGIQHGVTDLIAHFVCETCRKKNNNIF